VIDHLTDIGGDFPLQRAEFRGDGALEARPTRPDQDGDAPLPRVAVGPDAVLASEWDEDADRPDIGQRMLIRHVWSDHARVSLVPTATPKLSCLLEARKPVTGWRGDLTAETPLSHA
jgi:hypothetical protein